MIVGHHEALKIFGLNASITEQMSLNRFLSGGNNNEKNNRIYGVSRPLLCREYPHTSKDTFCQFVEEEG